MTNETLYEVIGEISDRHIKEAKQARKEKRTIWLKWSAMAACLCLVIALALPIIDKDGPDGHQQVQPLNVIKFNGAYYECIDMKNTKILDAYNLPHEITTDMIGYGISVSFDANVEQKNQILYQYIPYADITVKLEQERPQRAVYILEENGVYSFALFCNYIGEGSNAHTEVNEMFAVYGIDEAEDIAYIIFDKKKLTDINKIKEIFENLYCSYAMGNDDYQNAVFKGMSEKEQQELCSELADSMIEIKIVTTEGVVINHIKYYPTTNYVSWGLNYYKLNNSIQ